MNIVVFGIGNRLMMDDGIGVYIVEELIKCYKINGITYVIGETDVEFCLDFIDSADKIIIIDSLYNGNKPGTIRVFPVHEKNYESRPELSLHTTNLIDVIKSRYIGLNAIIIGVQTYEINYGIGISKPLKDKFTRILNEINKIIDTEYYM